MENGGKNLKKLGYKPDESVIFLTEKIIENALNLRATDVHIEPRNNNALIRFRIHGTLQDFEKISISLFKKIAKHFKFLGELNFSENIFAQTSKISYGDAKIRISVSPTFMGDKITLRIISAKHKIRSLEEIGLWGENLRLARQSLRQPSGIIITIGSGKNNTNFSLLKELSSSNKSIVTVEKSIEKGIENINQIEVKPRVGLNYAQATKSALLHNPDVLLIDNLQDGKTAEIAFEAASRGKLVIISLPVQKISEVVPYLDFLKVPEFLIATNLLSIISQKLIRTTSENVVEFRKLNKTESKILLRDFAIDISKLHNLEKSAKKHFGGEKLKTNDEHLLEVPSLKEGIGEAGFTGVTGIFEVLSLLDGKLGREFKNLIATKPNSAEIEEFLEEHNFTNLKIDGLIKSLRGKTTVKEVMRRTGY